MAKIPGDDHPCDPSGTRLDLGEVFRFGYSKDFDPRKHSFVEVPYKNATLIHIMTPPALAADDPIPPAAVRLKAGRQT